MARAFGRILTSCLNDPDFQTLTPHAQRLYWLLLAQKDLDNVGIVGVALNRWAGVSTGTTVEQIREYAAELHERRYVLFDERTDEAFVRSFMRNDEVVKQPQLLKNALRTAPQIASGYLRHEVAVELRRLGRDDADAVANAIDPGNPPPPSNRSPIQADGSPAAGSGQGELGLGGGCAEGGVVVVGEVVGVTSRSTSVSSSSDPASPDPDGDQKKPKDEPQRDDVDALCFRLRDWMIHNGVKAPTIGKRWKQQARLLLDLDKRELSKALNLIDWCQQHSFWMTNIHSIPTFREQYDKLALQAREEWRRNGGRMTTAERPTPRDPAAALADLYERAAGDGPTSVGQEVANLIGDVFLPPGRGPGSQLSELEWNRREVRTFIDDNLDRIRTKLEQRHAG